MAQIDRKDRVLVIGLGNRLSGDDGFGSFVIGQLRQNHLEMVDPSDLVDAGTDLLRQLDHFASYARVVIIDALLDPQRQFGNPGEVVALDHDRLLSLPQIPSGAHQMSPLLAIQLFPRLYPQSETRFTAVVLCTNGIASGSPIWATGKALDAAAALIRSILLG